MLSIKDRGKRCGRVLTFELSRAARRQVRVSEIGTARGARLEAKLSSARFELAFDLVPERFGLSAVVAQSEDRNSTEVGLVD